MNLNYEYEGFGVDLLKQQRPMVFYSADNQIVARDHQRCFVYNPSMNRSFCYDVLPNGNLKETKQESKFQDLKNYVFSNIQAAEYIERHQTIKNDIIRNSNPPSRFGCVMGIYCFRRFKMLYAERVSFCQISVSPPFSFLQRPRLVQRLIILRMVSRLAPSPRSRLASKRVNCSGSWAKSRVFRDL